MKLPGAVAAEKEAKECSSASKAVDAKDAG